MPHRYIIAGDEIAPYLVVMNSHDGSSGIILLNDLPIQAGVDEGVGGSGGLLYLGPQAVPGLFADIEHGFNMTGTGLPFLHKSRKAIFTKATAVS